MDSLESRYVINVAKRADSRRPRHPCAGSYEHFFRVEVNQHNKVRKVYEALRARFPTPTYRIDITYWNISGRDVSVESLPE